MRARGAGTAADEQLYLLVEAAANAMLVIGVDGRIVVANAEAERLLGYDAGTLAGRLASTLGCAQIAPIDEPQPATTNADPLTLIARGHSTVRRRDGNAIPLIISTRRLVDADGDLALVTLGQSTDRRPETDRRTEPSGGRPVVVPITEGRVGRWTLDVAHGVLTSSDEMLRTLGLEALGAATLDAFLAVFDDDDRALLATRVDRTLETGEPFREEARIARPDGADRTVVVAASVERSATGAVIRLSGYVQDVTESKNAQRERRRLDEYVALSNQSGKVGIWELDLRTNVSIWDRNMYALYGIEDASTPPTFELWEGMLHPHDRAGAVSQIGTDMAAGVPSDSEYRIVWPNGEIHYIRSLATMVVDSAGDPTRIIGTNWDVTEVRSLATALREEKEALIRSEARYRALTEAMPQLVWVIDAASQFEYVNARWAWYTGCSPERSRSVGIGDVVDAADMPGMLAHCRAIPASEFECEARLRRHDDVYRWHLVRGVPFHDASGDAGKWMITATDIEERKSAERMLAATIAELEHRAHHDAMTNLPNRTLLVDRLTEAMVRASRTHTNVVVLYVDLDRFKAINDSFGHGTGDLVLQRMGERIVETLRAGDTASRVGGDEFIVVCENIDGPEEIERIAARLLAAVTAPTDIGPERINIEASIGISAYPIDGCDSDTLIRKADAAMYAAKQSGRNTFRRYSNEAHTSIVAAAAFEAELRHAIGSGELVVYYQPILDLVTGQLAAAEALVRWQHPQRGLLAPGDFIGFAEERGLIAQIGDVVLHDVCAMLGRLRHAERGDVSIAVNVSAHQFGKRGFVDGIVTALAQHGIDPRRLTIEITESVVMGNTRTTSATLDELRAFGVNLSIDDFGTGYSSLAYIKKFPITTLKIDRSFVNDIADDQTDQAIAKTIITLAHSLGMKVIAEGVETQAQLARLRSFGVDSIQGYLVSRPVPAAVFELLVLSDIVV